MMGRARMPEIDDDPIPRAKAEISLKLPPLAESYTPDNFHQRHVDIRLSMKQAVGMRKLFDTLKRNEAQLESNRFVQTPVDAVRWLMEQVAERYK